MINFILAIIFSTSVVVFFKFYDRFKINNLQSITINYLVAAILGFSFSKTNSGFVSIITEPWVGYALLLGFSFIVSFHLFAIAVQKVGISATAVASRMSVIIPVTAGLFLYKEESISILKMIGVGVTFIAFYLTLFKKQETGISLKYLILPALLLIATGFNDSMLKFTHYHFSGKSDILFISSIFLISFVFGSVFLLFRIFYRNEKLKIKNLLAGTILGILNFAATFFFFISLGEFQSNVYFPIFNVSIVVLSAFVGFLIFSEKLTKANHLGILLAVVAIILISIG